MTLNDEEFLNWIADRFVNVIGESEHVDFVQALRGLAEKQKVYHHYGYRGDCDYCNTPDSLMEVVDAPRMLFKGKEYLT